LVATRGVGFLFARIRQPRVVGEMAAGLLLGPSLLGLILPGVSASLFPSGSLAHLNSLSQIGLILFMFLIGAELDLGELRRRGRTALFVTTAVIALPFLLGALLALVLSRSLPRRRPGPPFRPVRRHGDERHRLPGAGPHPGRVEPARHEARNRGDRVRGG